MNGMPPILLPARGVAGPEPREGAGGERVFDGKFGELLAMSDGGARPDADRRGKSRGHGSPALSGAPRGEGKSGARDDSSGAETEAAKPPVVAMLLALPVSAMRAAAPDAPTDASAGGERAIAYGPRARAPLAPPDAGAPEGSPAPRSAEPARAPVDAGAPAPWTGEPAAAFAAPLAPAATPLPPAAAALLAYLEREPSLRAALTGGEARLSLRTSEGELLVHIQVHERRTDLRITGAASGALEDRAMELHAALVARGLSLGAITVGPEALVPVSKAPATRDEGDMPLFAPPAADDTDEREHPLHITA